MAGLPLSFGTIFLSAMTKLEDPLLHWFQTHPSPPVAIIYDVLLCSWLNPLSSRLNICNICFMVFNANAVLSFLLQRLPNNAPEWLRCFIKYAMVPSMKSWGIIFNTFAALDGDKLKIIKEEYSECDERLWAVGPLPHIKVDNSIETGIRTGFISKGQSLEWLDSCDKDKSVAYVGFGTQISPNKLQTEAIPSV